MAKKKIFLHLRITVKDHDRGRLASFLNEAIPYYEKMPGTKVRLLANKENPTRFVEVIEYDEQVTFDADQLRVRSDPMMIALLERWRSLLAMKPEVEVYEEVTAGSLWEE